MQIAEENYLKAIYSVGSKNKGEATTNAIADQLQTKASSVTDMVKKLADKGLVNYKKYKGVSLTPAGKEVALKTIRKHRLWEVFLVEKLQFGWEEVHEVAEQLEHIQSKKLTNSLDNFLGNPKFDPHGDPIPDQNGILPNHGFSQSLSEVKLHEKVKIIGVKDTSTSFLQYLDSKGLNLGVELEILQKYEFDDSLNIITQNKTELTISHMISKNLIVSQC